MAVTEIDEVLVAEDAVRRDDGFEVGVERLLGFEVLDDGLDDQRAVGQFGQFGDRDQPGAGGLGLCRGQLAFFGHFRELGANAGHGALGRIRAAVEQLHRCPAAAATWAMPAPIAPVPTTAITASLASAATPYSPVKLGARFSVKAATPSA